eukprot:COSAG01_NODE_32191_length_585_cov_0.555556_2_plen_25_part_01
MDSLGKRPTNLMEALAPADVVRAVR